MSYVVMDGGRSRSRRSETAAVLGMTLIFLVSPSTPIARPTALCVLRSL